AAAHVAAFEKFVGSDGQNYFRLRAANGEIVLQSEGYTTKAGAEKGIASIEQNGDRSSNYEILEAKSREHYFRITAANGEIIGRSEMYLTKSNAARGAKTVQRIVAELNGHPVTQPKAICALTRLASVDPVVEPGSEESVEVDVTNLHGSV